jgi:CubicO group peptidase (beta-lactamase class C family)
MDVRIIGGLALVCAIVVVAGVLFYNFDFNTPGVNDSGSNIENTTNDDINNTSTNQQALTLLPDIQPGPNPGPSPSPGPSPGPGPSPDPTPDPMDRIISLFDEYLNKYYDQSLMPGMAVVIVKDGKIIYLNTLGVKDLASGAPVDENTLFGICSISKQFTSTNIAQLIDKGLMSWDDPISKYYSVPDEFLLYNDLYVSNNITIRDILMHNSGLANEEGNELTYFNYSFSDTIFKLRYVRNITPFRENFHYNSVTYALGGYSAARVTNTTWDELIKKELLEPLGMTSTVTSFWDFLSSPNHVTPYKLLKNGTMVPYDIIPDTVGPAGSIYSSISEMANWLKFQINNTGYYNGVQIVSKKELDETRIPQIQVDENDFLRLYGSKYGLGWFIDDALGHPYNVNHPGDSSDFHAQITVYPSKNLGMVILTNGGTYASSFRNILDAKFKQLLTGNENIDLWPATKDYLDAIWKPVPPTPPYVAPRNLTSYVGVYSNLFYGNINVTINGNNLACHYGTNKRIFNLEHWSGDVFNDPYNDFTLNFTAISNGKTNNLTVTLQDYTTSPPNSTTTFNRTKTV